MTLLQNPVDRRYLKVGPFLLIGGFLHPTVALTNGQLNPAIDQSLLTTAIHRSHSTQPSNVSSRPPPQLTAEPLTEGQESTAIYRSDNSPIDGLFVSAIKPVAIQAGFHYRLFLYFPDRSRDPFKSDRLSLRSRDQTSRCSRGRFGPLLVSQSHRLILISSIKTDFHSSPEANRQAFDFRDRPVRSQDFFTVSTIKANGDQGAA
ncbi:hypothetical protein PGT21_000564 [Puccinia graminis f. sp. tritici]|uniref:Uncharacterized protein n=1 Tax=Puccinia graminis f. sp. tritici TaxID=56615 RepID=A0A5B0MDW0_PUCGR|nr:hypothetical protein PGT21_000564 [Puccinia graminis f. sp. tritici]